MKDPSDVQILRNMSQFGGSHELQRCGGEAACLGA